MEFRLLGPLEVIEGDRSLALGGAKPRSLLALLLLHANQVVSADHLIDALWGDQPPATAAKSLQVHISKLRKQMGDGRLVTRTPGYLLQVDPSELDLARFERLVGDSRGADPEQAAKKLGQALALWRGEALADLAYEPFARAEIARLGELRLAVLEQRIDADLAGRRHAEIVGELEVLVAAHPLRERLLWQLMLALYRSGRQAEALAAYRAARTLLSEELGLEPSEELRQLEQAILRHDSALDPAEGRPAAATSPVDRSILVVPEALDGLDRLMRLARPLASSDRPHELIIASVVERGDLGTATATLSGHRDGLLADGLAVRTAAFASSTPARDIVRVASQQEVDLLLMEASEAPLEGEAGKVLEEAPCDVALLVRSGDSLRPGPVVLPFGAAWHDWAALELGAWVARATGAPLHLMGAATAQSEDDPGASRLLADASLIVQKSAGVVAEPLLASPGRSGITALAEGAGLLVVGLSERWRQEGLGQVRSALVNAPPAPLVLIRRGPRPGGLAPAETRTRFGWSLTGGAP